MKWLHRMCSRGTLSWKFWKLDILDKFVIPVEYYFVRTKNLQQIHQKTNKHNFLNFLKTHAERSSTLADLEQNGTVPDGESGRASGGLEGVGGLEGDGGGGGDGAGGHGGSGRAG